MSDTKDDKTEESESSGFGFGTIAAVSAVVGTIAYFVGKKSSESPQQCNGSRSTIAPTGLSSQQFNRVRTCSQCSICLDNMDVAVLPCKHSFHKNCIKKWLEEKAICPTCRAPVHPM